MRTQCIAEQLQFAGVERRRVVAAFDGTAVQGAIREAQAVVAGYSYAGLCRR